MSEKRSEEVSQQRTGKATAELFEQIDPSPSGRAG